MHLEALWAELKRYYDSTPVTFTRRVHPDTGARTLRFHVEDPSDALYLCAGDFAHNLRSSLDHVVYSLACQNLQKAPTKQIQWPVVMKPDDDTFKRQTKGVPENAVDIIERLQPYHRLDNDDYKKSHLWRLHRLDIIDKHRRIAINQHAVDFHFPTLKSEADFTKEIMEDGCVEITFAASMPPVDIVYGQRPEVLFGDPDDGLFVSVEELGAIWGGPLG